MAAPTPAQVIAQALQDPQNAASDGQSVTSRPVRDLIDLLNYQAGLNAIAAQVNPLYLSALRPAPALDAYPCGCSNQNGFAGCWGANGG